MDQSSLISVLVPLYNEEEYISELLERVLRAPLPSGITREIIVVDDGSRDDSFHAAMAVAERHPETIRVLRHAINRGKGAAIRTALDHARGEFSIIQDADLEYDPAEYGKMFAPLLRGEADAVFGSRFLASAERRVLYFWHALANHLLTTLCNLAADVNLTDMETCYKAFRTSLLQSIPLRSDRFGIEPEMTLKLAQRHARLFETFISYHGRTYAEGKKIGLKDAFATAYTILRFWLFKDIYKDKGGETLDTLAAAPRFNTWMADTVKPYLGNSVLELGAGIGNLSQNLCRKRARYVASDIDAEHIQRLKTRFQYRPRVEIQTCDLTETADFQGLKDEMDSVVCLNVLEHVEDDLGALRNIYSSLAPGGRAIVLVPQDPRAYGTLDELVGHYRRYSKAELKDKMERAGFQVETILDFNRAAFPGWYVNGRILKRQKFSRFQVRVFDRLVWLWRRADRMLPWPAASIIGIAAKPSGNRRDMAAARVRPAAQPAPFGTAHQQAPAHFTETPVLFE